MARVSKYDTAEQISGTVRWCSALYVRLSREDGDKVQSESVISQKALLTDFVSQSDDIELYKIYVDDGWSGTNFERPQFSEMMQDVRSRKVNCVIVKDLSRFGRNYIDSGLYLEKVFPTLNVRFISVNDRLDSYKDPCAMNNITVPFRNIINDEYCRDISNKVRSALDTRRQQGKFIGAFPTYGYSKSPENRNQLVIDSEAAAVVRDIYDRFIGGMSIMGIAKALNDLGIANPTAYKQSKGLDYKHPTGSDGLWCDSSVRRILQNELYTGKMVQGKNRVVSYKVQLCQSVEREKWITVEGTHEAIIPRELFDTVQQLFRRDTRTAPKKREVYLFSGFVKCADCGRAMNRKTIVQPYGTYNYYVCSTYKRMRGDVCSKHTIREDKLAAAVLTTIKAQIDIAVDVDRLLAKIDESGARKRQTQQLEKALEAKYRERERLLTVKSDVYPDWKTGVITGEEYRAIKAKCDGEMLAADAAIEKLLAAKERLEGESFAVSGFAEHFIKYKTVDTLTREMLIALVENIYIHEGGNITIDFRFSDAFALAAQFIEEGGTLFSA